VKKIMERVINEMIDHKAQADVFYTTAKSLKMSAQNGSISEYKVSSSQILGVRAIKDGKVGISYTEALDDESVQLLIKQALDNAEMSEANANERVLEISGHISDEAEYPEAAVDMKIKTEKALWLESEVKKRDSRVTAVPHNSYAEKEYADQYLSSRGRSTSYSDKHYSIVTSALLDEAGKKANYYDYHTTHKYNDLDWERVVKTSLYHAQNILTEQSLPTGKYHVKFSVDCLKQLMECFGNFYSAKSAKDKVNPWAAKLGEEVISTNLSIEDQPVFSKAYRISKFDSEGVERKPMFLVQDGILKNFYHNSATAAHFNTTTTGHASRGASSSLNVSGTHMVINGKNKKPAPDKYLEVITMDGLYSGANRVTGNFSVAVKGYVWEKGQMTMTFGNITLSGNLIELLKRVEVIGTELETSIDQSFFSVPLIFDQLSIAGQ
jgi:PmbA protein